MTDPFDLRRFLEAQENVYASVLQELRAGRKRTHWMWYIFPQIAGLGGSAMSRMYAIASQAEARTYCEHPVLGVRLRKCTGLVLGVEGRTAEQIFAQPDSAKFRSCMTLFETVAGDPAIFREALLKYFGGEPDPLTLAILESR